MSSMRVGEARSSISSAFSSALCPAFFCAIGWLACFEISDDYSTNEERCKGRRATETKMFKRCIVGTLFTVCLVTSAQAEDAAALFARYKAASGGAGWDAVKSLRADGTLSAGGLGGDITII